MKINLILFFVFFIHCGVINAQAFNVKRALKRGKSPEGLYVCTSKYPHIKNDDDLLQWFLEKGYNNEYIIVATKQNIFFWRGANRSAVVAFGFLPRSEVNDWLAQQQAKIERRELIRTLGKLFLMGAAYQIINNLPEILQGDGSVKCLVCNGFGKKTVVMGDRQEYDKKCEKCNGTGRIHR